MQYVTLYKTDRAYGGPEEGGWWYECGEVVRSFPVATLRRAERILSFVQKIADCRNKDGGNHDLSSVNCEGYFVACIEDAPAANYPAVTPHYE